MLSPVAAAARNNAAWCHAVARASGIVGHFSPVAWTSPSRTPLLYPDAVTLTADARAAEVLGSVDGSVGCSVKDSFAALDLGCHGFRVLFDAEWIWYDAVRSRPPPPPPHDAALSWTAGTLRDDVVVLAGHRDGALVAGAVANAAAGAVGLTNLFCRGAPLDVVWRGCATAVAGRFPGAPLVGYESGDALAAAVTAGFETIGPLRVWLRDE